MKARSSGEGHEILIVDSQPIVREGLVSVIQGHPNLRLRQEIEHSHDLLVALRSNLPDLLILDLFLDGPDGLGLVKQLHQGYPELRMLVFSMNDELVWASRALRAGARGYVMKDVPCQEVLTAVHRVLGDEIYVSESVGTRVLQQLSETNGSRFSSEKDVLSDRELEVFRLIGKGKTTRQISRKLFLSVKTVETYQAHIKRKLALASGRELLYFAIVSQH